MHTTITEQNCPYSPRGAAWALFRCTDQEVLMEGPAGTGKSRALLEKANLCALRYPGCRILLVRKTRASMTQSILVTLEEKVLPADWGVQDGPSRANRQSYRYANGSMLVAGGMDKASKVMSSEYDVVLAFEARELSEDDWESLLTRLRNGVMPYKQAIADTNPDAPTHWLNRRAESGRMTRLRSRHEDNPSVTPDYLARLNALTGVRYLRLRKGAWAAAQNVVYEDWDPSIHMLDCLPQPIHTYRIVRSIDFGFTHPFVCQWWAIDGDGRMVLYREMYQTRGLVEDHARQIVELTGDEPVEATVSDHAAEERATLERYGVPPLPAYKAIKPGLQIVAQRLRRAGDGRPRLMLLRDALLARDEHLAQRGEPCCTAQEFDSYVWPTNAAGHVHDERPVDRHNHGMDAMRYAAAYVDGLGASPLTVSVV